MPAAARFNDVAVRVRLEGSEVFCGDQDHVPAVAAATTVRAASRLVLLAVERDAAVAPATRADDEAGFIYELQRG
jgi:hypothetical protein